MGVREQDRCKAVRPLELVEQFDSGNSAAAERCGQAEQAGRQCAIDREGSADGRPDRDCVRASRGCEFA